MSEYEAHKLDPKDFPDLDEPVGVYLGRQLVAVFSSWEEAQAFVEERRLIKWLTDQLECDHLAELEAALSKRLKLQARQQDAQVRQSRSGGPPGLG